MKENKQVLFFYRQGDQVDSYLPWCHSQPPSRPVCGGDSEFV